MIQSGVKSRDSEAESAETRKANQATVLERSLSLGSPALLLLSWSWACRGLPQAGGPGATYLPLKQV